MLESLVSADLSARDDPLHPSERDLVKRLLELPAEIAIAAERRAPHRLTTYAHDVAQQFSPFYRDCRVVGAAAGGARVGVDRVEHPCRVRNSVEAGSSRERGDDACSGQASSANNGIYSVGPPDTRSQRVLAE